MSETLMCRIENISKSFAGVNALKRVNLEVRRGEIHAIVGENGAGKSTLMNVLSGVYHPDDGTMEFDGKPVLFRDPRDAQQAGIAMIHQELSLSRSMSVAENIFEGRMPKNRFGLISRGKMSTECRRYLDELGVESISPSTLVRDLSVSQMQLVEIAKAMSLDARLLMMDEPTSSLTAGETSVLLEIMRSLRAGGVSILFVTHKLEEVMEVSDRITVLRDGVHIDTLNCAEADIDTLVSLMVGREFERTAHRNFIKDYSDREVALEVEGLTIGTRVRDVSFTLYKGEVLGLTGLVGAGRTEVLQGIFGIGAKSAGVVKVFGVPVTINHPADAIRFGIGMVPEGRKEQGMFLKMNVLDNMTMVHLRQLTNRIGLLSRRRASEVAGKYLEDLSIKTPGLAQVSENLSGGNQQKTIIARWLMHEPKILFLDEPTHGIDIGAKMEIYNIISGLSQNGVSIVFLSSELPEVLNLCDRILVMHHGEIKGILSHQEADQVKIMSLILAGNDKPAQRQPET